MYSCMELPASLLHSKFPDTFPFPPCILPSSAYNIIADPRIKTKASLHVDMENAAVKQAPNFPHAPLTLVILRKV